MKLTLKVSGIYVLNYIYIILQLLKKDKMGVFIINYYIYIFFLLI